MDTPDKNRISAVSLCNFEDSPVFKYINDLSPIEPVKSAPADNVLNAFSFASPSALFTSPQFNSNRESRFSVKRHQSPSDLLNPTFLLNVTVNNSRDSPQVFKTSELCAEQLKCGSTTQLDESSETKAIEEQFSMALRSGGDGCDIQMVSCDEISAGSDNGKRSCGSLMKPDEDMLTQSNDPIELGADLQTLFETEKMKIDNESSVVTSISGVAGVLDSEQQIQKIDPGRDSFTFAPQQFPPIKNVDAVGFFGVQGNNGAPDITLSSSSVTTAKDSNATTEDKEEKGLLPSRKQRSVRRRCLTFDVGGIYKKKPLRDSTNDSPLESTAIEKVASPEKQSVPSKKNTDDILPIPTIGLHLNGLVNTLTDGNKLICKVGRVLTLGPATSNHSLDNQISTPDSTERVMVASDNGIIDEVSEKFTDAECLDNSLPTGERQQIEGLDESVSCKRCKCRRSKCLKLYCDCFAAGLYCIEPCSCQDCFNKPIHEDIVLSTRRQIEARNPLAFAPKVVASIDSASDLGDENNKTPASARHKRGCNCKKSSCLKKYCECFLMGVGCSPCCRCISCKNSFGQKDEQFRIPCALESDAVTIGEEDINEDVKDLNSHHHHHHHHGDHDDIDAPRKIQACQNPEREGYLQTIPDEETSL